MKKERPRFNIGDWVCFKTSTDTGYVYDPDPEALTLKKIVKIQWPDYMEGQIVGMAIKYLGIKRDGYQDPLEGSEPYLEILDKIILWKVALGYLNQPVLVADEDIDILERLIPMTRVYNYQSFKLPLKWTNQPKGKKKNG